MLLRLLAAFLAASLLFVAPASAGARFFAPAQESASAAIAADRNGGLHAAFTGYDKPTGDAVYYRYCAAACETAAGWQSVELKIARPINVQIATTPDGHPRLFIQSFGTGISGASRMYDYAACEANCLDAGSWTIVPVGNSAERTFSGLFEFKIPEHSFAVDDQGRPHFVYVDANYISEPDHYGTFHLTCEAACTDPENWTETNLAVRIPETYTTELWDEPVIATAPGGKLRVIAKVYALADDGTQLKDGLYYYQCDADCADRANWQRARVVDTGYGSYPNPTWDLDVLPDGRPRIALFAGSDMEQQELGHELIYLWCDTDCGHDNSWNGNAVTAPGDGESPDLTFTADGHPRLAFLGEHGDLGYLACDSACESPQGKWDLKLQDATQAAEADRPTALPFTCDGEVWNGFMPRVALSGSKAWFAYDLVVEGRCLYKDYGDPVPTAVFNELWRGSRLSWTE